MRKQSGRLSTLRSTRIARKAAAVLLVLSALTVTAVACGWMGTWHSVRFNAYQNEREMGRLPPLPTLADGQNDGRVHWDITVPDDSWTNYTSAEKRTQEAEALWDRALAAEEAGEFTYCRNLLQRYLKLTQIARQADFGSAHRQQRRNSAIDKLDALRALDNRSGVSQIRAYLKARRAYDENGPSDEVERALDEANSEIGLRDNVAYLRAASLFKRNEFGEAAHSFDVIARKYPRGEKREASLFMKAVALMKSSRAYTPTSGDEVHLHEADKSDGCVVPIDEAWHKAFAGFERLVREYPRGQYVNDARGWLAYLLLRKNDRAGALVEYYRLLADKHDENARIEAAHSLTLVRHHTTEEEMVNVEKVLASEPDTALAYAYHNIYNYAIDPGDAYPPYEELPHLNWEARMNVQQAREDEWNQERAKTSQREFARVLAFTKQLMARNSNLAVGGRFALRAAQSSLELGDNDGAVQLAQRALQRSLGPDDLVQALWISGIAHHRLKQFDSARASLNRLLEEKPEPILSEGARRLLAMIAEDSGDIEAALDLYLTLDYRTDIAYFIDVLMTPEQLAAFIQKRPNSLEQDQLMYALGVRYLRSNNWDEARRTFAKVKTTSVSRYDILPGESGDCNNLVPGFSICKDPKKPSYNSENIPVITPDLILRDIQTANDLEALEQKVSKAEGEEAKAEALYQLASYQFEATDLLFYNPVAWGGSRYRNLSQLADQNSYRSANEIHVLFNYMQEHDTLARALKIYLEIFMEFPQTRAARDALYTAAVCHERLANHNPYWRTIYGSGLHAGPRMVSYSDIKASFPDYQLPRGTYRWEPSTRTVSGRYGWAVSPKPAPRPTRMVRLKGMVQELGYQLSSFWSEHGQDWFTILLTLIGIGFTVPMAGRVRSRLHPCLTRVRARQDKPAYQWTGMFCLEPQAPNWRERLRKYAEDRAVEFWELMRDKSTRPLLVESILMHTVVIALLVSLFTIFTTMASR